MTLIKLIVCVAISYCYCSLISCATEDNSESKDGSSTSGDSIGQTTESQRAELEKLAKFLFMSPNDFNRERPRLLETSEVGPMLNLYADWHDHLIGTQAMSIDQTQTWSPNPAARTLVETLRKFISFGEEEDEEKMVKNCGTMGIMENVKKVSLLIAKGMPILSKFNEENYRRIIQKCVSLVKSSFESFSSLLGDTHRIEGENFGRMIGLSMHKLKLFGSEEDEGMKQMAFAEASARFVETFGGPGTMRRAENTNELEFKNHFINWARCKMDSVCEDARQISLNQVFDFINVLLKIEPGKIESLDGFDEYYGWVSVGTVCNYWPRTISRTKVYNAHLSFHMDLKRLDPLKSLSDALFSPSASRIGDSSEIESRLKLLRDQLAKEARIHNQMFKLRVNELNVLLGVGNRIFEYLKDKENQGEHDRDLMQQMEPLIRYYESIQAHNIVFYLKSLIKQQTDDSLRIIEAILRAGIEQLAHFPQLNANLRELRRFVPVSNNIMAELTTSNLLTGLTDYFLSNLRNLQQMSELNDYQSRKNLVTRWVNQFMDDNCEKYKYTFDHTLLAQNLFRSTKPLSGLDDELKLVLFDIILCSNMYNILNHNDELTRLISSRVDGGGPQARLMFYSN